MHHLKAEVPYEPRLKFYPNAEEKRWANALRAELTPRLVVMVPNGSSCTKSWPYAAELARYLLRREDVTVVVLGDLREAKYEDHPRLMKVGLDWPMRQCMTFAQLADVVVGQETGIVNSVSFEKDVRKVVLMTHSSVENLTRDWPNTATLAGNVPCFPCHRLHYNWEFCTQDKWTQAAACQTAISVNDVLREIEVAIPEGATTLEAAA
jgi:ADP-heptose:LPS heptosyltransferase